jgi:hypothetical protein
MQPLNTIHPIFSAVMKTYNKDDGVEEHKDIQIYKHHTIFNNYIHIVPKIPTQHNTTSSIRATIL